MLKILLLISIYWSKHAVESCSATTEYGAISCIEVNASALNQITLLYQGKIYHHYLTGIEFYFSNQTNKTFGNITAPILSNSINLENCIITGAIIEYNTVHIHNLQLVLYDKTINNSYETLQMGIYNASDIRYLNANTLNVNFMEILMIRFCTDFSRIVSIQFTYLSTNSSSTFNTDLSSDNSSTISSQEYGFVSVSCSPEVSLAALNNMDLYYQALNFSGIAYYFLNNTNITIGNLITSYRTINFKNVEVIGVYVNFDASNIYGLYFDIYDKATNTSNLTQPISVPNSKIEYLNASTFNATSLKEVSIISCSAFGLIKSIKFSFSYISCLEQSTTTITSTTTTTTTTSTTTSSTTTTTTTTISYKLYGDWYTIECVLRKTRLNKLNNNQIETGYYLSNYSK